MPRTSPIVYDLCAGTGAWSEPYVQAGYDVRRVEICTGRDVRLLKHPGCPVHGVLAAPPCTHLCIAGATSWKRKGDGPLLEALEIVGACIRFAVFCAPDWWALENPAGRLREYLGPAQMIFDPCDYGDCFTKRTCLWGSFKMPGDLRPVEPTGGSIMDLAHTREDRSITPPGFARAFFKANHAAWWNHAESLSEKWSERAPGGVRPCDMPDVAYIVMRRVGRRWRLAWGFEAQETASAAYALLDARCIGDRAEDRHLFTVRRFVEQRSRDRPAAGKTNRRAKARRARGPAGKSATLR